MKSCLVCKVNINCRGAAPSLCESSVSQARAGNDQLDLDTSRRTVEVVRDIVRYV